MSSPNYDSQDIEKAPRPLWTVIKVMAFLGLALIIIGMIVSASRDDEKGTASRSGSTSGAVSAAKDAAEDSCKDARTIRIDSDQTISLAKGDAVVLKIGQNKVRITPSRSMLAKVSGHGTYSLGPEGASTLDGKPLPANVNTMKGCLYAIEATTIEVDVLH